MSRKSSKPKSDSEKCFCAFCSTPRRVYRKRHVSFADALLAAAAALLLSFALWQRIDPRALIFFVLGIFLAEIFIVFRWRLTIACPHCGFDPVLYKKKPDLAAAQVKEHMERKRADPLFAFSPPPKLPVIVKKSGQKLVVSPPKDAAPARRQGAAQGPRP